VDPIHIFISFTSPIFFNILRAVVLVCKIHVSFQNEKRDHESKFRSELCCCALAVEAKEFFFSFHFLWFMFFVCVITGATYNCSGVHASWAFNFLSHNFAVSHLLFSEILDKKSHSNYIENVFPVFTLIDILRLERRRQLKLATVERLEGQCMKICSSSSPLINQDDDFCDRFPS
jgi:hypothetical protein